MVNFEGYENIWLLNSIGCTTFYGDTTQIQWEKISISMSARIWLSTLFSESGLLQLIINIYCSYQVVLAMRWN